MRKASLLLSLVLLLSPACGTPPAHNGNGDGGGGGSLNDGGGTLNDGGGSLNDGGGTLNDGGGSLNDGGGSLNDGGGSLNDGGGSLNDGGTGDAGTGLLPDGGMCATCGALATAYHHHFHSHIVPSATGVGMNLTECTLDVDGDMTDTGNASACQSAGCQALYGGTIATFNTDCAGVSQSSNTFQFGLAYVDPDRLDVWEPDTGSAAWLYRGTAVGDGMGTYTLTYSEDMGAGGFSLGTNTKTYTFTILP